MKPWQTFVDPRTKRTIKSGLSPHTTGHVSKNRLLGNYRAIVLKTYATDAPERTEGSRGNSKRTFEIECDVLLMKSLVHYSRVPVSQPEHGVSDATLWIPRPTTGAVGNLIPGEPSLTRVSRRGTPVFPFPPNPETLDGDHVIVEFIEGDPEKPIITRAASHTSTKRLVVDGTGWSEGDFGSTRGKPHLNEKYMRYRGVEFRINDVGDVLLDTVGATTDQDAEIPDPARGGHVRVRIKPGKRFTIQIEGVPPGSGDAIEVYRDIATQLVQVDLVEGATQAYVRGTAFATALTVFLTACEAFATAAAAATATAIAASGAPPLAALVPAWTALGAAFTTWGVACGALKALLVPFTPATPTGLLSSQIRGE